MDMNIKKPKIRFKGYTNDWEQQEVNQLIERGGSGGTPSSTNLEFYNGSIPFLSITDITNSDGFIFDTEKHITEAGLKSSSAWIVPKGAITLAMYASFGKVAILRENVSTSQAFYNMVINNENTRDFLFHFFKKMEVMNEWLPLISTGTQANLNAEKVLNLKVKIPQSSFEKRSIGNFMYKMDSLISLHQRKYEKLKNLKKYFLEKLFPKNDEKFPNLRFKNFTNAWEQRKYGNIGIPLSGGNISYVDLDIKGKHKCVLYGDLYTKYDTTIFNIVNRTNKEGISIKKNDILFPQSTTVDALSLISPACMNEENAQTAGVFVIRPYNNIDGNFVSYYTKGNSNQRYKLSQKAQGLTIVHLYYQSIKDEIISVPQIKEQNEISNFFIKLDNLISLHQRKCEVLKNIKKSFLEKMFV